MLQRLKPMLQRLKRKRGGQVGNQNAVKHDYYTAVACQARWAAWKKLQAEERRRSNERSDHACRIDDLISNRADDLVSDRADDLVSDRSDEFISGPTAPPRPLLQPGAQP
jgi:hypothetical protein